MKSKNFILCYGIFPFDVMVSIGETDKEIIAATKKVLKRKNWDGLDMLKWNNDSNHGKCVMIPQGGTIIRLRNYPNTDRYKSYLAHEIFHAVEFLMQRVGISHNNETTEIWAYTIGYLTEQIYKKLVYL